MSNFTTTQRTMLLAPVQPHRVGELDGHSHLAAWDVTAHLNRLFGFEGWDKEILSLDLVYENVGEREVGRKKVLACSVGYRCVMRLTVRNPEGEIVRTIDDAAMGTASNQRNLGDAHDLAVKSAVSYALKRCAKDLGDQFGLSLYNKGQYAACVQKVWPYEHDGAPEEIHNDVHGDGIDEGDAGFGSDRMGDAPPEDTYVPAADPSAMNGADNSPMPDGPEPEPEPVREPKPAKPAKKPKPEPTPPPEKRPEPEAPADELEQYVVRISEATVSDHAEDGKGVRDVWIEVQNKGLLDVFTFDPTSGKQATLRELMVRRVNEIAQAGAA